MQKQLVSNESGNCGVPNKFKSQSHNQLPGGSRQPLRKPTPDFSNSSGRWNCQRRKAIHNLILEIGDSFAAKSFAALAAYIPFDQASAHHSFKSLHQRKPKKTQIGIFINDAINPSHHHLR